MISQKKLQLIRATVRSFISRENQMEEDGGYGAFLDDERVEEEIGYCALRLSLKEETVSRYFHEFLETGL